MGHTMSRHGTSGVREGTVPEMSCLPMDLIRLRLDTSGSVSEVLSLPIDLIRLRLDRFGQTESSTGEVGSSTPERLYKWQQKMDGRRTCCILLRIRNIGVACFHITQCSFSGNSRCYSKSCSLPQQKSNGFQPQHVRLFVEALYHR